MAWGCFRRFAPSALGKASFGRGWEKKDEGLTEAFCPCQEEIPRQLRCIALYLAHIAGAYLLK